jgi:hypothetical protein
MNTCNCSKNKWFTYGHLGMSPYDQMKTIGIDESGWRKYVQCCICNQIWLVDEFDKLQYLFAIKVDEKLNKEQYEKIIIRLRYEVLCERFGGESIEVCSWYQCKNKALNGLKICYLHHQL